MKIHKDNNNPLNFDSHLQPLFDAMKAGKRVKSVTCMGGTTNKDKPERDFKVENFVATDYWHEAQLNGKTEKYCDWVWTDIPKEGSTQGENFFMNWVRSFEL